MTTHIHPLPHQSDRIFLTDGGIETCLIFLEGLELRDFAAFELLTSATGREHLKSYYRRYADVARDAGRASSSKARPGGPARTGPTGWIIRPRSWTGSTAMRST
jgi:S-methylmethionine-dependent homocysteine/selenocysteine methylase